MKEAVERLEQLASDYGRMADHLENRLAALEAEGKLEKLAAVVSVNVKRDIKIYRHHSGCLTTAALLLAYYHIAAENETGGYIKNDLIKLGDE